MFSRTVLEENIKLGEVFKHVCSVLKSQAAFLGVLPQFTPLPRYPEPSR